MNIFGFGSPDGSAHGKERIANQRAEAVKNILVKEYGISANRIETQGKGVGSIFGKPAYNRASICVTE